MSFISKVVKGNTDIDDELLFANTLAGAKAASKAYLTAVLACTTPELRTLFQAHLSQCINAYTALVDLGIKKGWIETDSTPEDALIKLYLRSNVLFSHDD